MKDYALHKYFVKNLVVFFSPLHLTGYINIARVLANNNITMCADPVLFNTFAELFVSEGFYRKYIPSLSIT